MIDRARRIERPSGEGRGRNIYAHIPMAGRKREKQARVSVGDECHMEVPVPPSVLWQTVADIDSTPNFLSTVICVERIDGSSKDDPLVVGTKWTEVRQYKGNDVHMIKTVHNIGSDTSPYPRMFAVNVSFPTMKKMANTSTIIVSPAEMGGDGKEKEGNTSILAGTFVGVPGGFFFKLQMLLFGASIRRRTAASFRKELGDIAKEAIRRHSTAFDGSVTQHSKDQVVDQ